jgi:hypothetical protein
MDISFFCSGGSDNPREVDLLSSASEPPQSFPPQLSVSQHSDRYYTSLSVHEEKLSSFPRPRADIFLEMNWTFDQINGYA